MSTKFCLFVAATLHSLPLLAMWGNPVMEPQEEAVVASYKNNSIKVALENDFGSNHVVKAMVFDNHLNDWKEPINLSPADLNAKKYLLATDPEGNAAVMWQISEGESDLIQATLFSRSTNTWSSIQDLCHLRQNLELTHLGMNESGNVFASWTEKRPTYDLVFTTTYSKKQDRWSKTEVKKIALEDENSPHVMLDNQANSLIVRNKKTHEAYIVPVENASVELLQKAFNSQ
jgi:hypothetical protein